MTQLSVAIDPPAVAGTTTRFSGWQRHLLRALAGLDQGCLVLECPEGQEQVIGQVSDRPLPGGISSTARLRVHDPRFFRRCVLGGDLGFAESFLDGDWSTPDLTAVLAFFVRNAEAAPTLSGSRYRRRLGSRWPAWAHRLRQWWRAGSREQAARDVQAHYDLSNEFFQLWLDETMMYSAARWSAPELTLPEAQQEKNEQLGRMLQLKAEDHVLEIGTGWGGWAMYASSKYGCRVTTVTLSRRQAAWARARVQQAGLAERVTVIEGDYRDVAGAYDKLVSIEMMEALGHDQHETFCRTVTRLLRPGARMALQFITVPDERYEQLRTGFDFIQKHIFPGSLLLSVERVNRLMYQAGRWQLRQMEDLGEDYARTLACWQERFTTAETSVRALGFDDRFQRLWHYYLAYCRAGFALRHISVVHALYERPTHGG
jgi:cyclopropane-fatty-acyl-phospholipid synthase